MSVSIDAIVWAYRLILGREPESQRVIDSFKDVGSLDELRWKFFKSPEFFRTSYYRLPMNIALPLAMPRIEVETEASEELLTQLRSRIARQWEALGAERPHHSVLTSVDYLPKAFQANEDAFWKSGYTEVQQIKSILAQASLALPSEGVILELGCGVGRVTIPLSMHARKFYAFDISAPHVDIARIRAEKMERNNIEFIISAVDQPISFPRMDFFYSKIVLQHNTPPIIRATLESVFASLNPGGIALFQVPTYARKYSFSLRNYLNNNENRDMEMNCIPQYIVFEIAKKHDLDCLLIREDNATGRRDIYLSNTFLFRKSERHQ